MSTYYIRCKKARPHGTDEAFRFVEATIQTRFPEEGKTWFRQLYETQASVTWGRHKLHHDTNLQSHSALIIELQKHIEDNGGKLFGVTVDQETATKLIRAGRSVPLLKSEQPKFGGAVCLVNGVKVYVEDSNK